MHRFWMLSSILAACPAAKDSGAPADSGPADLDGDGFDVTTDCDDADPAVFPGAVEVPRDGVDNDCDPATCSGASFEPSTSAWALPAVYGAEASLPFDQAASFASCTDNTPAHTLADVSGDDRLDLVVTFVCGDEATGDTRWLVHGGGEAGFTEAATDWTLPNEYGEEGAAPFANAVAAEVCGDGIPAHTFTDVTGDGLPDLVITQVCDDETVGRDHWLVHAGSSAGFEDSPAAWTLPGGYGEDGYTPFVATAGSASCLKGIPTYGLADLTGDGATDLIVSTSCSDDAVGETHWVVYPGNGSGFGAATSWALPAGLAEEGEAPLPALSGLTSCGEAIVGHDTRDLDGDGRLDLVVTETCDDDPTVGDTRWLVYPGGASGFAAASTDYLLPTAYGAASTTPFSNTSDLASVSDDTPGHELVDLDGDARLDLVITEVPSDPNVGTGLWAVHFGGSTGFAEASWPWTLPAIAGTTPLGAPHTSADCAVGHPAWTLLDLDGDALLDLIVTESCADATVGDAAWERYESACAE
ncbi:hypothetical protein LBMAG42_39350 [Deltaproteobacteria bacterium]|nr:hypothetical protein LBMAG42_39350 [Deltaproteobacteria bacterium]